MLRKLLIATAAIAFVAPAYAGSYGDSKMKDKTAATEMMQKDIVATAQSTGQFETLLAAAKAAGLADALATTDNITVFAPTDAAFAKLPEGTVEDLLKPENKEKLAAILQYHVVPAAITSGEIADGSTDAETLGGQTLQIVKDSAGVKVGEATVVSADVKASNGVIHVIDTVLIPAQ